MSENITDTLQKKGVIDILLYLDEPEGFNQIHEGLQINTATLNCRLQMLVENDLVKKVNCPKDSRCVYYSLTPLAKKVRNNLEKINSLSSKTRS